MPNLSIGVTAGTKTPDNQYNSVPADYSKFIKKSMFQEIIIRYIHQAYKLPFAIWQHGKVGKGRFKKPVKLLYNISVSS